MAGIAEGRLREERRSWRKDHPIGFVARPRSKADGSTDLLNWDVRPRRFNSHQHAVAATPPRAGRHPGQKRHDVGGLRIQPHDGVQQRPVPKSTSASGTFDAAVLARSSGEEPASPRHRKGVASMAWRTTR